MTTDALDYLMEDPRETERLERKTDRRSVLQQATWAGIAPGMRVADVGCGPGLTSKVLWQAVQPAGEVVGIDFSAERVAHAREHYAEPGLHFNERDFFGPLDDLGLFDFIWVRFTLEFHRSRAAELLTNLNRALRPGGRLCLIDLDYNCLSHCGLSERLNATIADVVRGLEERADFDPYAGRRLYGLLHGLGYEELRVDVSGHHIVYGPLEEHERFNWDRKVRVAARRSGCRFELYPGGFEEFADEFFREFNDPARFTYSPLIQAVGCKPPVDPT